MRLTDWRSRLIAYIDAAATKPFEYGQFDCSLLAAGAVLAMTGEDPAAALRGRYTSLATGTRRLREAGHLDHVAYLASLGKKISLAEAQTGDIAVVDTDEGPALAVVCGGRVFFLRTSGLATIDLLDPIIRPDVYRI